MKMIRVRILNAELEAALLNPEVAKKYDEGVAGIVKKADEAKHCESCCGAIEMQCNAVIDFLDDIFGKGSAKEVVGKETDLLTCLEAYRDIVNVYEKQVIPYLHKFQEGLGMKVSEAE